MAARFPMHISPAEFTHPELMDQGLVDALGQTREALGRPMFFTQTPRGDRHPNGDALPAERDGHHATFSLHLAGIDHAKSYTRQRRILKQPQGGLAADWDARSASPRDLFDTYLQVEATNLWGGIGLYPYWFLGADPNPGLHTDLRPRTHPKYGARWIRDDDGVYWPLTLYYWDQVTDNWAERFIIMLQEIKP